MERRRCARINVCLDVRLHAPALQFVLHSRTVDMSTHGVFVRASRALPVGARVRLEFQRGQERNSLLVDGEVVRMGTPREGRSVGVAVRFLNLGAVEESLLDDLIMKAGRA